MAVKYEAKPLFTTLSWDDKILIRICGQFVLGRSAAKAIAYKIEYSRFKNGRYVY
jgi:hypothetical protein